MSTQNFESFFEIGEQVKLKTFGNGTLQKCEVHAVTFDKNKVFYDLKVFIGDQKELEDFILIKRIDSALIYKINS